MDAYMYRRNVAIYLLRHLRGETLKGVGEAFGINRNSTVC